MLGQGCQCRAVPREEHKVHTRDRDNFWRPRIEIVGKGRVTSVVDAFDCWSDGATQAGVCGPKLVVFKELSPPLLHAIAAPGWRLDHWASSIRNADGTASTRPGPMPDGDLYLNGFGYTDTGAVETVTAVFVIVL